MTEQQMREYWEEAGGSFEHRGWAQHAVIPADVLFAILLAIAKPIDMVLHCPACGLQHIDAPEIHQPEGVGYGLEWTNPPHRSHLCHGCGHVWRPADVPTNGVQAVNTKGEADSPIAVPARQVPAGAAPVNPHWDYLKRYWQMGFDGVSLDACTGDAPIKAWHEGKAARESMTAPTAQPAPAATKGDSHG